MQKVTRARQQIFQIIIRRDATKKERKMTRVNQQRTQKMIKKEGRKEEEKCQ